MLSEKTQLKIDEFLRTKNDFFFSIFTKMIDLVYMRAFYYYIKVIVKLKFNTRLQKEVNDAYSKTRTYIRDDKQGAIVRFENSLF